jgi:hypothetical protein
MCAEALEILDQDEIDMNITLIVLKVDKYI